MHAPGQHTYCLYAKLLPDVFDPPSEREALLHLAGVNPSAHPEAALVSADAPLPGKRRSSTAAVRFRPPFPKCFGPKSGPADIRQYLSLLRYEQGVPDDDLLTDQWEACALRRAVTHEEHLRIARVLLRRHGREEATHRLVVGTRANCETMDAPERFDEALTRSWSAQIADAMEAGDEETFDGFIRLHPELARSDLLGPPAWKAKKLLGHEHGPRP